MKHRHIVERIVFVLLIISGLDLGFLGLFGQDIIGSVFGPMSFLSRLVYIVIGLAAIYRLVVWIRMKIK
jgi:uncharacterized membrane protein YuzA (DUF378 family)